MFNWKCCSSAACHALNWADTQRERERCVRTLGVDSKTLHSRGSTGNSQRLLFWREKSHYGVCNVAKLATPCISISPTMGWATGQTENTRCVNHTLIKLVPLKWIVYVLLSQCKDAYSTCIYALIWMKIAHPCIEADTEEHKQRVFGG